MRRVLYSALAIILASACNSVHDDYLTVMEKRLSDQEKEMLKAIYEPTVVGVPLEDARSGICILPDGELRAYGRVDQTRENRKGKRAYLSSTDCGLSWKLHYCEEDILGSCTYIADAGFYIRPRNDSTGLNMLISKIGPNDTAPRKVHVCDKALECFNLPMQSNYSDRIWITGQWKNDQGRFVPVFIYTDDLCESFTVVELPAIPKFEIVSPHRGMRWDNCGTEPDACELSEGRMMMVIRNSLDSFYCSYSEDGGCSWSTPEPSPFHGTATTAFLLRLHDGRVISFWNNTRPLAELDHTLTRPAVGQDIIDGVWEDVFTNRDANHAAITDDAGKTWTGARELFLNSLRNNADYRYIGGVWSSNDKSVHQFQAYELPYGKILVSFGQNIVGRKMAIFDVDWLYERTRSEDFMLGLGNVSTQVYVNDLCGHTAGKSGNGHCAWNRTSGALMCPDPEGTLRDVVGLTHHHDPRLRNDLQGVVWNFPASNKAQVEVELYLNPGSQVRLSLMDCWYNPSDENIGELAQYSMVLGKELVGGWHKVRLAFDTDKANVSIDGGPSVGEISCKAPVSIGLSYLHIQDIAGEVFVRNIEKKDIL